MKTPITRRQFGCLSLGTLAFTSLSCSGLDKSAPTKNRADSQVKAYGPLESDPNGLLDLPKGFSYNIISQFGDTMSDGLRVPDYADGMGCFSISEQRIALVRNHELKPEHIDTLGPGNATPIPKQKVFDTLNGRPLPGGTTTIVYDMEKHQRVTEHLSLIGTVRNCAGGATPWGSWLSCEETVLTPKDGVNQFHGWVFEVDAKAKSLTSPKPLKAMGRFKHEAAAVDPRTSIVYMTEDQNDSLLYRFIPHSVGELDKGGVLQALCIKEQPKKDTRNWHGQSMMRNIAYDTYWVTLENPESPDDSLRYQGADKNAAIFARGEGIHFGNNEVYFCCTSGGAKKLGQVMRYRISPNEGTKEEQKVPGKLDLFFESHNPDFYNFGDNLTVAPNGHLIVCEDQGTKIVTNHLRGITPSGKSYAFAKLRLQTELAGACFSPDGSTLFVNIFSPTKTLAIRGPWQKFNPNTV